MKRNYHRKLWEEIITENYEIMRRKEGTVAFPSLLEGNGLRTAYIMWGNH